MTSSRSFVVLSVAMLATLAAAPTQAIAQESGTAGASEVSVGPSNPGTPGQEIVPVTIPATRNYGTGRRTGSRSMFTCDVEGSFFRPNRLFLSATDSNRSLPCILRETQYRQDGDHGGGGGRPNPGDPTSNAYPDTRFNLADVLDDYRVSGSRRAVSNPPSSGGLAAQPVNRQPLEPQLDEPEPGKKAAAYAARRQSMDRKTIPDAMEPMEANSLRSRASRVTRLPVRTAPVVTKQIMEERIYEGEIRRAERSGSRSDRGVSERSERPPTPRSSVQRAARSRPAAAARPQSSGAARSSAPSAASPKSSSKSSRRGSSQANPQR
jgi:hypothetical protein